MLRLLIEATNARGCTDLRALDGYGPLFHNGGLNMLSNAWPWIGRALVQEGFEAYGSPTLAMYCPLDRKPIVRLPLPSGAELRYDWITRIGSRDATEGGYHLFLGEDRAAESMWHFGEKYVTGAGNTHTHLFWLGTNPPHRGKGLGRILLRETLARMQEAGARSSDLRCNINNFYAHTLYRAEGYEPMICSGPSDGPGIGLLEACRSPPLLPTFPPFGDKTMRHQPDLSGDLLTAGLHACYEQKIIVFSGQILETAIEADRLQRGAPPTLPARQTP